MGNLSSARKENKSILFQCLTELYLLLVKNTTHIQIAFHAKIPVCITKVELSLSLFYKLPASVTVKTIISLFLQLDLFNH